MKRASLLSSAWGEREEEVEDEILGCYLRVAGEGDLYLSQLADVFDMLEIPSCFTARVLELIEKYYGIVESGVEINLKDTSHLIVVFMVQELTVTDPQACLIHQCLDIVDIDKLLKQATKLVKFRNHYHHIVASWRLFGVQVDEQLTVPELKRVRDELNIEISDHMLIDMVTCGKELNFDGAAVGITTFAEILGKLGELP